ncbi:Hypothetical protein (Fragment) [Durusdinium trenchii]|uniref:G domain-containing protein n=1 Tax=Durusdinium trenchii TaxID=1381693 RepID=A0ABP0PZT7_9DINO
MALSHPKLVLDQEGNLLELKSKTGGLLSADEIADCVKFRRLRGGEVDGELTCTSEKYDGQTNGMKVNVIGGATGAGKTSLIQILAGGMQTEAKNHSDTKCPTIYVLELDIGPVAFLDTAGLCDTDAEANKNPQVQDLLVQAVAATIQKYNLVVVNFLMCVDSTGRLPGNFCEVWPQMQVSLGGEKLNDFCHFVMTKANADSRAAKQQLSKLKTSPAFLSLQHSALGWPVVSAGHENLDEFQRILKKMWEEIEGLDAGAVRADEEGLQVKRQKADQVQRELQNFKDRMNVEKMKANTMLEMSDRLQDSIDSAYDELASLGDCTKARKDALKKTIHEFRERQKKMREDFDKGKVTERELEEMIEQWQQDLDKELDAIREMEKLGNPFQSLARAARAASKLIMEAAASKL